MGWISTGNISYIIDNLILPLGSSILILFFLLFFIKSMRQDQIDIFYNGKMMSPKDAKVYLKQMQKEKFEKEFSTLLEYGKLEERNKAEYMKLREESMGINQIVKKIGPKDKEE